MRRIFSTVRAPQLPALTVESLAMSATVRPAIFPRPVTTPSAGSSGSAELAKEPSSTNEPGSRSRAMRSLANSFPVSEFLAWYLGAPPSRMRARRARRVSSAGMRQGALARGVPRLSAVPTVESPGNPDPRRGANHGVLGHRARLHQELPVHEPRQRRSQALEPLRTSRHRFRQEGAAPEGGRGPLRAGAPDRLGHHLLLPGRNRRGGDRPGAGAQARGRAPER